MKQRFHIPEPTYKCVPNCMCCPKTDRTPQGPSEKSIEEQVILKLYERYGRLPTEEELFQFVFGDDWQQFVIWNKEKAGFQCQTATKTT